jgi:hypothetical protein
MDLSAGARLGASLQVEPLTHKFLGFLVCAWGIGIPARNFHTLCRTQCPIPIILDVIYSSISSPHLRDQDSERV